MNLLLLAAGLGARLKPLTLEIPKPAVPFLNVPLGLYQFRYLNSLPISNCIANTFHLSEKIEKLYSNQLVNGHRFLFSHESPNILGSAGGLKKASNLFNSNDTVLMMNADEVYFTEQTDFLQQAYQQHLQHKNLATLIVMRHPEAGKKFGAIWCDQKQVKDIGKNNPGSELQPWHYIGIIFMDKKVLSLIPENIESNIFYDVLIHELPRQSVEIFPLDCSWYETGNPTDYLYATQDVLKNITTETLGFINTYDPSQIIENPTGLSLVSDKVKIDKKQLAGFNVISGNTSPETLASTNRIENSVLFDKYLLNPGYFS